MGRGEVGVGWYNRVAGVGFGIWVVSNQAVVYSIRGDNRNSVTVLITEYSLISCLQLLHVSSGNRIIY